MNNKILDHVKEDMPVYEPDDDGEDKIGTVEFIRYGEAGAVEVPDHDTLIEILAEAFTTDDKYPEEVYQRLYTEGFIRIERGLEPDKYALSSQIKTVEDGKVYLAVEEEELLDE